MTLHNLKDAIQQSWVKDDLLGAWTAPQADRLATFKEKALPHVGTVAEVDLEAVVAAAGSNEMVAESENVIARSVNEFPPLRRPHRFPEQTDYRVARKF